MEKRKQIFLLYSCNAWKNRALIAEKRIEDLKGALQEAMNAVIKKF